MRSRLSLGSRGLGSGVGLGADDSAAPLEQYDAGSDRDVQRRDLSSHRNSNKDVAMLTHELVQSLSFSAKHEDRRRRILDAIMLL